LANRLLGVILHIREDLRRDFLRREILIEAGNMELIRSAHVALGRTDGVRIGDHLTLRGVADDLLAIALKGHDRRGRIGAFRVRNDFDFAIGLQIRDDRIGRPKIDADNDFF
jgi:hypothetical protein